MESIYLENDLTLSFEKLPHTIRLIILKNNEEWVCRKEKLNKLFDFSNNDQAHVFKGRLRLHKTDDYIDVLVKNEKIGTVSAEAFIAVLSKLK